MRLRTVAIIVAPTALWLLFGGASSAQLGGEDACRDTCEEEHMRCIGRCGMNENPIDCEARCEDDRIDCVERC